MTVKDALRALTKIRDKYGDDAKVYFDCPECEKSFALDGVVTKAVHLVTGKESR